MEKEFIYVAGDVNKAVEKGLKELNLTEDKVKIEVIDAGSSGIFGLFKKEAKVKLIPLMHDFKEPEKEEIKVQLKEDNVPVKEAELKDNKEEQAPKVQKEQVVAKKDSEKQEKTTVIEETSSDQKVIKKEKSKREDYIEKNKDSIVGYLTNIVRAMGYDDATVSFKSEGNRQFTLNIKTEQNTSLIIGKRGTTLNSLQFLVNNYAKKFSSHFFRIEVDCDNYRENRKKTLEELALNLAKKSKKIGKAVELEPMTSTERKIIHNALAGIKNVETESRGEEPFRYLVIKAK